MSKIKKYLMFGACFLFVFTLFMHSVDASWADIKPSGVYDSKSDTLTLSVRSGHGNIQSFTGINCAIRKEYEDWQSAPGYYKISKWYKLKDVYFSENYASESAVFSVADFPVKEFYCSFQLDLTGFMNQPETYKFYFTKTTPAKKEAHDCGGTNYGSWTESTCQSSGYKWDSNNKCCDKKDSYGCYAKKSESACNADTNCKWFSSNLAEVGSVNYSCKYQKKYTCSEFTKDSCPSKDSYGEACGVFNNRCEYKNCGSYKESTSCNEDTQCEWKNNKCTKKESTKKFDITFDAGSNSLNCTSINPDMKNKTKSICYGNLPKMSMYTTPEVAVDEFLGWSESKSCTDIVERHQTLPVEENVTYYACYKKNQTIPTTNKYTITIDGTGGAGFECPQNVKYSKDKVCSQSLNKGTKVVLPTVKNLKDDKYKFMGWNTTKDCNRSTMKKAGEQVTVNSNVTYYACYQEYVRVNRYLMEGAVVDKNAQVPCGTNYYISYCTEEKIADNKFEQYCYYRIGETNNYRQVYRNKLTEEMQCSKPVVPATSSDLGYRYVGGSGSNFKCGDRLYITTCNGTSNSDFCNYTKVQGVNASGTVKRGLLKADTDLGESYALAACKLEDTGNDKKCSAMKVEKNNTSAGAYNLCYDADLDREEITNLLSKYYRCENGYTFDETYIKVDGKPDCNDYICNATYRVRCKKNDGVKPVVSVTSGFVDSTNYGTITVNARAFSGEIDSYYVSERFVVPTARSEWTSLDSNKFTLRSVPGTLYIWVRDSEGNISNPVTATVFDNNNTKNTINKLELYDASGKIQTPSNVSYDNSRINSNKYVMMSNNLRKDSNVLADGFNPFNMEYKIEVDSPTLSVYATLTSTDSKYVSGYEPRTVNLSYGVNTILIKIEDNEGKVRTYTILATRVDDRTSDNKLSDLTVSEGEINFNENITDYKVVIGKDVTSVEVKSAIASSEGSYVGGYEPGIVNITGDTTVKLIKVKSQTGSTRTYVLTFVKEGTDIIEDKTLQIKDLRIPNVYIPFESNISNYSLSVEYETDLIEINPLLNNNDSAYEISVRNIYKDKYTVGSNVGIALEPGENFIEIKVTNIDGKESYYRFTIIRKEFGLGISDDKALKELRVLGYDIKFDPTIKDYTVRIKQEKSLVITAVPNNSRAEVFIRGNDELTGYSTVRIKVVAENGEYETYSIDIKKDPFNKAIEIASIIAGGVIILGTSAILVLKKKRRIKKEYFSE